LGKWKTAHSKADCFDKPTFISNNRIEPVRRGQTKGVTNPKGLRKRLGRGVKSVEKQAGRLKFSYRVNRLGISTVKEGDASGDVGRSRATRGSIPEFLSLRGDHPAEDNGQVGRTDAPKKKNGGRRSSDLERRGGLSRPLQKRTSRALRRRKPSSKVAHTPPSPSKWAKTPWAAT